MTRDGRLDWMIVTEEAPEDGWRRSRTQIDEKTQGLRRTALVMWTMKDMGTIVKRLQEARAWRRTDDDWMEDATQKEEGRVWKMRE